MDITKFSLTDEQKAIVETKLRELLEICQVYEVPMFASVVTDNSEEETVYNNIVYGARVRGIILKNDQIQKHILIADGFDAVPKRENVTVDMKLLLPTEDDSEEDLL